MMTTRLPFNALHVFCTVVSRGGFRQAAHILHVTPGAVSKQIQLLEDHLKEVLFDRMGGSIATPTPAGLRLYKRVSTEMEAISKALGSEKPRPRHAALLVDTSVTLAMYWLIPLLAKFNERHPSLQVQIRTTDGPVSTASPVDIFIRRDESELGGLSHHRFMEEHSVLVCTPAFLARLGSSSSGSISWVRRVARIGMRSRPDLWPQWTKAQGIKGKLDPTIEYDNTVLAIQAALQSTGVLVVPAVFVLPLLETRALVLLTAKAVTTGSYSYAIGKQQESARAAAFAAWLSECGREYHFPAGMGTV